jgi:antitoxin (DNA-binding transcriptional repressor) of toxin-antitoxin stability system
MKTVDVNEACDSLGQYARELDCETIVVTDKGRTIAALVPIADDDFDAKDLSSNPHFLAILEQARAERRSGKALSSDDVRRELGLTE